ncbi:hypothetical protein FQ087_18280 [Sporosarcina sp. ANT_H38]|uniref:hypothetical protein n=1 Tax=Sporosarcina sp. ANT_H38 TaxID=2597358 RepID=UPI0011F22F7D|nr:hypothetical protein [Sporosarcina sp. ANT_H38]KAA0944074.1 hypothetical protein FQ087_18280 [Sporosarcina sp. ANT_H38]
MSKEKEVKLPQQYSKIAFLEAAVDGNESVLLRVVLEDGKTYTKDEVAELVAAWKTKEVKT